MSDDIEMLIPKTPNENETENIVTEQLLTTESAGNIISTENITDDDIKKLKTPKITPLPRIFFSSPKAKESLGRRLYEQGIIQIFTPEGLVLHDDQQLRNLVKKSLHEKVSPRLYRLIAFILHAIISVLIITYTDSDFHITKVLSLGLAGMFITYFVHLYYLVFASKTAHRVYSLTGIIDEWTTMPITYRQLIYKYEPIQSISEFSAIGGGIANQMLVVISTCAWTVVLVQTLNNIWFEKIWLSFTRDMICDGCKRKYVNLFIGLSGIDSVLMFIGTLGLVIIGTFELDPFSKRLRAGHMTGVYLGFGCPIGFTVQQFFGFRKNGFAKHKFGIIFGLLADIVAVVFAILWTFYYNKKSDELSDKLEKNIPRTIEEQEKAQKDIKLLTIKNIVSESFTLLAGSLTLCLWLWHYNDLNPSYSYQKGVLPHGGPWFEYFEFIKEKYECGTTVYEPTIDPNVYYCPSPTMPSN